MCWERERQKMVAGCILSDDRDAQRWIKRLEARVSEQTGLSVEESRPFVARELGHPVTAGMVRSVSEGRIKGIRKWLWRRIALAAERSLEADIESLRHELELVRQGRLERDLDEVAEIEAHIATARRLLAEKRTR